ncbi:MAG: hypothetical protein MUO60_06575, partial [Clostridiaceae bacterium]|nr:hypothetical protein [Clostridiaceae bacterium]
MKKLILPLLIVLLLGVSIYSVTNYNKNKSNDLIIAEKNTVPDESIIPSESAAPDNATSTNKNATSDKKPA